VPHGTRKMPRRNAFVVHIQLPIKLRANPDHVTITRQWLRLRIPHQDI